MISARLIVGTLAVAVATGAGTADAQECARTASTVGGTAGHDYQYTSADGLWT